MNPVIYTTSTPHIALIDRSRYRFDYPRKRSAYTDCCYAVLDLNQAAKSLPDSSRHYIYRLKQRWLRHLYEQGYCVHAELQEPRTWFLIFMIDGIRFQWHIPERAVDWSVKEDRSPVVYEYRTDLPRRSRDLAESIALIEWCLGREG